MAIKLRTAHREQTAAWLTAGFLVIALALVSSAGQDGMRRSSHASAVEATLTPLGRQVALMVHLEPLRPWLQDPLGDPALLDSQPADD